MFSFTEKWFYSVFLEIFLQALLPEDVSSDVIFSLLAKTWVQFILWQITPAKLAAPSLFMLNDGYGFLLGNKQQKHKM